MTSQSFTITEIKKKYSKEIDPFDLDILIGFSIEKSREFVLTHPEIKISADSFRKIEKLIGRRQRNEPLAYILGNKEFYGLNFLVNNSTLIPRPETELLVDLATNQIREEIDYSLDIIDVGTGSGNIIISILNNLKNKNFLKNKTVKFFASDISKDAIFLAKKNARLNQAKEISFIHGNLLDPILKLKKSNTKKTLIIIANLPYLSDKIYKKCPPDVKKYEPKTALYSPQEGLYHYIKLFKQLKNLHYKKIIIFLEISPEQKTLLLPIIKNIFLNAQYKFGKDLANKWRVVKIKIESKK